MPYPKQTRHNGPLIYLLTFPNGKKYVGQTSTSFEVRMTKHKSSSKLKESSGCRFLNAAIRKYGWKNVTKEILIYCDSDNLDYYENKFINLHDTLEPTGYNLMTGGNSNKSMSQSTKDKTRLSHIRNSIYKNKDRISYGCIVKFKSRDGNEIKYAIVDHPVCEYMCFNDYDDALVYMQDCNIKGQSMGIDCSEYDYFNDDNEYNTQNTHFDIKYVLNQLVSQISKEHLSADRWKRINK